MSKALTKPRQYNRITKKQVAAFIIEEVLSGNGSQAVRKLTPTILNVGDRAFKIRKKAEAMNSLQFIDDQLEQIGVDAVNRLGNLVNSENESVATKNVHFAIDHIRGQAVKRTFGVSVKANIQSVLD